MVGSDAIVGKLDMIYIFSQTRGESWVFASLYTLFPILHVNN